MTDYGPPQVGSFAADQPVYNLPKRPDFGKAGRAVKIAVNAYPVTQFPTNVIHQYDVQIGDDGSKRGLIKKIWHTSKLQEKFGKAAKAILFDGNKLAWTLVELPFGQQLTMMIDLDEEEGKPKRLLRENKHRIVIRKAGKVPLQVVQGYLEGKVGFDNDVLVGINFLDHLMRETPSKHFVAIKRSFFQQAGCRDLDGGVEAWKGIFQSVRLAQGGRLIVNVDVATACFWSQGSVLDVALRLLKFNSPEDLQNKINSEGVKGSAMRELRRIKKVQFFCKHRPRDHETVKKSYTIEGFAESAQNFTFECKRRKTDGTETKETISAAQYFLKTYNIRLKYPRLPLLKTKKKNEVFPMELCYIVEGQRYPFKLNERQTADMIKFTVQRPQQRADHIKQNVQQLDWAKDPILTEYGMKIDTNMLKAEARVLPVPKITYGPGSQEQVFAPRDGKWDLRGKKFAKTNQHNPLNSWGIMIFGSPRVCDEASVKNFIRVFITTYVQHGGVVVAKDPPIMYADPKKSVGTNIFELFKKSGNKTNSKPQMLLFILQQKSSQPYNEIKGYCDIQIGVPSQCLQSRHVQQAKPQYCSNVCMKFNAKLGGASCYLDKPSHPLANKEATILIGADVSHAAPGANKASFASMVGSTDVMASRFAAIANTNGNRVEVISSANMVRFITTMLRCFKAATGSIPQRILYFRDGVSEGQYEEILESELNDIKEACKMLQERYKPKITITICSKRHHFRFFPSDKAAADRNGNPVPGTIVERDITHPTSYDFYLNSHNAIQGTARPVHYTCIYDENKMPVDLFQALIYNTCYTYMRATNAVSLIPATYYAHLASARARAHEQQTTEDTMTITTSSEGERRVISLEEPPLRDLHPDNKIRMWFI
jgi:eukaryotic translation initiation factor 2C